MIQHQNSNAWLGPAEVVHHWEKRYGYTILETCRRWQYVGYNLMSLFQEKRMKIKKLKVKKIKRMLRMLMNMLMEMEK